MPRRPGTIRPLDDRPHRWAPTLRELSLDYADAETGAPTRRHVATRVLQRTNTWALLAFACQDWRRGVAEWSGPRYRLARVQRYAHGWRPGKYIPLSAHHVEALGGTLAEFAVDVRSLLRTHDPRDRYEVLPPSLLTFAEHPGTEEDAEDAYDGP